MTDDHSVATGSGSVHEPGPVADAVPGDEVTLTRVGSVATVQLSRPRQRNALTAAMKKLLREQLEAVAGDEGVRAVVLAAQGPAFCVGQDLGEHAVELRRRGAGAFDTVDEDYSPIVRLLATCPSLLSLP